MPKNGAPEIDERRLELRAFNGGDEQVGGRDEQSADRSRVPEFDRALGRLHRFRGDRLMPWQRPGSDLLQLMPARDILLHHLDAALVLHNQVGEEIAFFVHTFRRRAAVTRT